MTIKLTNTIQQRLADLLKTDNPLEQLQIIEQLQLQAQLPTFTLTITHDPRTNSTDVVSVGEMTIEQAQCLLRRAWQELDARKGKQQERSSRCSLPMKP